MWPTLLVALKWLQMRRDSLRVPLKLLLKAVAIRMYLEGYKLENKCFLATTLNCPLLMKWITHQLAKEEFTGLRYITQRKTKKGEFGAQDDRMITGTLQVFTVKTKTIIKIHINLYGCLTIISRRIDYQGQRFKHLKLLHKGVNIYAYSSRR